MFDCYKLSDAAIAQIAKVLQVAILTGTDITDNLRLMSFIQEEGKLMLEPNYEKSFNENIEKMTSELQHNTPDEDETSDE
jgi:hypothetical protein